MSDVMREEFEKYILNLSGPESIERKYSEGYMLPEVNRAWIIWKNSWNTSIGLFGDHETQYKIGDTLWFANGQKKLIEGKVVHIFGWGATVQYVLEYDAIIDSAIECRMALLVSETPEGPINMTKLAKKIGTDIRKRLKERTK